VLIGRTVRRHEGVFLWQLISCLEIPAWVRVGYCREPARRRRRRPRALGASRPSGVDARRATGTIWMTWNWNILRGFNVGVAAGLGHRSVYVFPGCVIAPAAAGVAHGLAQQLRVPPQLGDVPLGGVALPQQLLRPQRDVQQTRLSQDFHRVEETVLASSGGAVPVKTSGFEDGGGRGGVQSGAGWGDGRGTGGGRAIRGRRGARRPGGRGRRLGSLVTSPLRLTPGHRCVLGLAFRARSLAEILRFIVGCRFIRRLLAGVRRYAWVGVENGQVSAVDVLPRDLGAPGRGLAEPTSGRRQARLLEKNHVGVLPASLGQLISFRLVGQRGRRRQVRDIDLNWYITSSFFRDVLKSKVSGIMEQFFYSTSSKSALF